MGSDKSLSRSDLAALMQQRDSLIRDVENDNFWLEHLASMTSCEEQQRIVGDRLRAEERIDAINRQLAALRASLDDREDD